MKSEKIIIELAYVGGGFEWFAMWPDGEVRVFGAAEDAKRAVQKRAAKECKDITVSTIEWRNAPEGWEPPQ